jgi:hypothetical protein
MATTSGSLAGSEARGRMDTRSQSRVASETKHATKTTEFYAMIAAIAGILIAAWWIGRDEGAADFFKADQAWLYITIVASAYMVSRGLAKSGSHDFADSDPDGSVHAARRRGGGGRTPRPLALSSPPP